MRVGLTGGIASGKTTTANILRALGAAVIDSDELAHEAIVPGQPAYREIVEQFGTSILDAEGRIDRHKLGEIVFNDDIQRKKLNAIVHPRVRAEWQKRSMAVESGPVPRLAMAMIPLLYETNLEREFKSVIVVGCHEETQAARLAARGLNAHQVRARLRAQLPIAGKLARADFVIWNEYSLAILEQQTCRIWNELSTQLNQRRN